MFLSDLVINGFRKFNRQKNGEPGLTVHFQKGLNVLVGENDSGKTAIIDAIRLLLGEISDDFQKIKDEDFFVDKNNLNSRSFQISAVFQELTSKEAGIFFEWLSFDENGDYQLRLELIVERKTNENNQDFINRKLMAGELNSELILTPAARSFLKTNYLKPLRNAKDELTPGFRSHLPGLIMAHSLFKGDTKNKENLVEIIKNANVQIENFFNGNTKEIDEPSLTSELTAVLSQLYDMKDQEKAATNIQLPEANFRKILKQLSLNPNSVNLGLGNMNLVYIATELALMNDHRQHQIFGPNIILIEEIEAHLHVQAQIRLIKYLEDYLVQNQQETSMQFILSSHSISLVSSVNQKYLIYVHNNHSYSMHPNFTLLKEEDYEFLNRFLDATKANLFFAKGLLLVEGYAENILIPALAELIDLPLHKYGISIVNVGGRSFENYLKLFARKDPLESISLPISVIRDSDVRPFVFRINEKNIGAINPLLVDSKIDAEEPSKAYQTFNQLQTEYQLKFMSDNYNQILGQARQLLSSDELNQLQENAEAELENKFASYNVNQKTFICPSWTLEYALLQSPMKEMLIESMAEAHFKTEKNKAGFIKEYKLKDEVETYQFFEKYISKTKTAELLAIKIRSLPGDKKQELRNQLLNGTNVDYILHAIEYACGQKVSDNG